MDSAPISRAEYLKRDELAISSADGALTARWGEAAGVSRQSSALAGEAAAGAETNRQLALMGSCFGLDQVRINGVWPGLEGETVRIDYSGRAIGVTGEHDLLVTASRVDRQSGITELTGLVQL